MLAHTYQCVGVGFPSSSGCLQAFQKEEQRREENQQQIAMAASHVLQEPEGQLGDLRLLVTLASDKDSQVPNFQATP